MRGFGFAAAIAMALFAAGMSCIDVETAYQQCVDEGRCADPGADSGSASNDSGTTGGQDSGHDSGVVDPVNDSGTTIDSGFDAGVDSGIDAGFDAGSDGFDAGFDAGVEQDGGEIGIDDGGSIDLDAGFGGFDAGYPATCQCPPGTICQITAAGIAPFINLHGVFVGAPGDVWVTGDNWTTKHLTNGAWVSESASSTTSPAWVVQGPSTNEVWQFGGSRFARQWFSGTWYDRGLTADGGGGTWTGFAAVPNVVLAYGGPPVQFWRRAGANWVAAPSPSHPYTFMAICGKTANDIHAVGFGGQVFQYDAGTGSFTSRSCDGGCPDFFDCSSTSDGMWLVGRTGQTGVIGTVDGGVFDPEVSLPMGDGGRFWGAWGPSFEDAWAVGTGGTVYRRQSGSWSPMISGTTEDIEDVWGYADAGHYEVWMVGTGGTVFQYCE